MLQGFIIAFSMYSNIPMPKINQNKKNRQYAIAFFPFVGLVIAAFIGIWLYFAPVFHFSRVFISCTALILPFLVTGNIHFHGFLRTVDALASHKGKEEKIKLPEFFFISTSACQGAILYFLFSFAVWNELYPFFTANTENDMTVICLLMLIYIISRCLSGLSILTFPKAKNIGKFAMLDDKQLKPAKILLLMILFICCLFGFFLQPMISPLLLAAGVIFFFIFRFVAMRHFNGISDELVGWFLQNCELFLLTVFLIGCKIYY